MESTEARGRKSGLDHLTELRVRENLAAEIARLRRRDGIRGDDVVARYDTKAGDRSVARLQADLARGIATAFEGTPEDLYQRVKKEVPSAKPSRMAGRQVGMKGDRVRRRVRTGDIADFGVKRLLAIVSALGYEAELVVKPKGSRAAERA